MPALTQRLAQQQTQSISPRLQQAVRLLQLSSLEFAQELRGLRDVNPFLDLADPEPAESVQAADDAQRESWQADGRGAGANRAGVEFGDADPLNLVAEVTSLATHLHRQLDVMNLSGRDLVLARVIVESLDEDGYLRTPLDEIAPCADLTPAAGWAEVRIALRVVQSLEPLGVGARSLQECLDLQARDIEDATLRALTRRIIDGHLDALAVSGLATPLAQTLELPVADVQRACDCIRRMDPHPGWQWSADPVRYIVPDVIVRKVRGVWSTALNPAAIPKVRLNQTYADLFERHKGREDVEMAGHLRDARLAVKSVGQRFSTILDVAKAIVSRQTAFLELGEMAIKPMGLREIAEEVGIHESTVSRVTNNKYMATRQGVFELKHFFSRAMTSSTGGAYSGKAAKELVAELIRTEPADAPLKDADITSLLARQGLVLCRRTITKYRRELHIPPAERRRTAPET